MARSTNRAFTELAKLRQCPELKKTVSSNKDGSQTSPLFQKGKAIQDNSNRKGNTSAETPRQKKAKGSEGRKKYAKKLRGPRMMVRKKQCWRNAGTTGPRPARPDGFKIKKCGQSTYADILGIIKGVTDLYDLQERVTRIRRTKAGDKQD